MEDLNYGQLTVKDFIFKFHQKILLMEEFMHQFQFVNLELNSSLNEFDSFICGDNYGRIFLFHG
jgi:hypothetical protein